MKEMTWMTEADLEHMKQMLEDFKHMQDRKVR